MTPETANGFLSRWENLRERLARSAFRSRFHLGIKEKRIISEKGRPAVTAHIRDFLTARLAPATPHNDGKQTPMRGHPCFIAQHATACCCRGCLEKWHKIPAGRPLTPAEIDYLTAIVNFWIDEQTTEK